MRSDRVGTGQTKVISYQPQTHIPRVHHRLYTRNYLTRIGSPIAPWVDKVEIVEEILQLPHIFTICIIANAELQVLEALDPSELSADIPHHIGIPYTVYRARVYIMPSAEAIAKIFAEVPKLNANGDNYVIFKGKVRFAAASAGASKFLENPPATGNNDEITLDGALLAAIMMKLPDAVFIKYMAVTQTKALMEKLKSQFDVITATGEAVTERELFTLRCHSTARLDKYLDKMVDLRDKLARMGNTAIDDKAFVNAIITGIPESCQHVVTSRVMMNKALDATQNAAAGTNVITSEAPTWC